VRASEPEHIAQIMNQQQARLDLTVMLVAVYTKLDLHGHGASEHPQAKTWGHKRYACRVLISRRRIAPSKM
jgi:hypothetical protein